MTSKTTDDGHPTIDMFDPASVALLTNTDASASMPLDPFDPAALRLSQEFLGDVATEVILTTLEVRKPKNAEFFRVNPDKAYREQVGLIDVEEDRSKYLVLPNMHAELARDISPVLLITAVSKSGVPFLWPLKLTKSGGRSNPWNDSARAAALAAETAWVRMDSNSAQGRYDVERAKGNLGEPEFPSEPFGELLRVAFAERVISSADHPVVRQRRGEI
jgi:hypothetical protein